MKELLDAGYAVVTPDALKEYGYWETNLNRYANDDLEAWYESVDHKYVEGMLKAIGNAQFGDLDPSKINAIGFSSGAYMVSRMAVNYQGVFNALVVQSGSYYYCSGGCTEKIANELPASTWSSREHPPTLFLHGSTDNVVPPSTSSMYDSKLKGAGTKTARTTDPVGYERVCMCVCVRARVCAWGTSFLNSKGFCWNRLIVRGGGCVPTAHYILSRYCFKLTYAFLF